MIPKEKIKLCAKNIVKALNIKSNEKYVIVRGGTYSQNLLEEIGLELYRIGALPHITATSDYFTEMIYKDDNIKEETLKNTPLHYLKMIEHIDAYVVIEPLEDPSILNDAPREKLKATSEASAPIRDVLYGAKEEFAPGKKWIYAGWPSEKAARFYGIEYDLLEKFIIEGMAVPLEEMQGITKSLGKRFENAKIIRVWDDYGTDFWVSVEGRHFILDDGLISDEQIEKGDLGGNLPAGEVFFPPREKQGEGKIFCPLTKDRYSNRIIKNLMLEFKDGKLQMEKITADNDLDALIQAFKQCEEIDKKNNIPEIMTYNIAELGIGCNPKITKSIGYILTDEKINGSVHVAFGMNNLFGGKSKSQMHWDFVTAPKVNIEVEYSDGTKKLIMENGKLS
ncbi:MAG: aminopeptidase [Promethearchaeota archaeon]